MRTHRPGAGHGRRGMSGSGQMATEVRKTKPTNPSQRDKNGNGIPGIIPHFLKIQSWIVVSGGEKNQFKL